MTRLSRVLTAELASAAIPVSDAQPGDIILAHSTGITGKLIRFFTRSRWNHVAVIVACDGTEVGTTVIQAEAHGVLEAKLADVAPGGAIAILPCPNGISRELVVSEARALERDKYGFVSIVSIFFNLLPLPIRLSVHENGTLICSAVGALALFNGGWEHQWPDLYSVTPAQLAAALGEVD